MSEQGVVKLWGLMCTIRGRALLQPWSLKQHNWFWIMLYALFHVLLLFFQQYICKISCLLACSSNSFIFIYYLEFSFIYTPQFIMLMDFFSGFHCYEQCCSNHSWTCILMYTFMDFLGYIPWVEWITASQTICIFNFTT